MKGIRRGKWRIRRRSRKKSKNTRMTVKRKKERFKKNLKEGVDTCLIANVYFALEYGVSGCSESLVSTEWPTSQLNLSK